MHLFDRLCRRHGIERRLTKPNHPWTNGQVERMNRTIEEATVKRYHYGDHQQLAAHLEPFPSAYDHARRLKTLKGLTPHDHVCRTWTEEPGRFGPKPYRHTPRLNRLELDTAKRQLGRVPRSDEDAILETARSLVASRTFQRTTA